MLANMIRLFLLSHHRKGSVHSEGNLNFLGDVLAKIGMIAAGLLVGWSGSHHPGLVMGQPFPCWF
jgi:Co/Zn/Cd efflux system component